MPKYIRKIFYNQKRIEIGKIEDFYIYNKDGFLSPALKKRVVCILLFTIDFELCFIKNITRDNKETYYILSFYERNRYIYELL